MAKKFVTMLSGQTIFDLALQVYGDPAQWIRLVQDNDVLINVHTKAVGAEIEYEEQTLSVTDFYVRNEINLVTGFPTIGGEQAGSWILATGFWNDGGAWDDGETWND